MEKLIFKYLSGKADLEEKKRVHNWILESEENVKFFAKIKNLYVMFQMPDYKTTEKDSMEFVSKIRKRNQKRQLWRAIAISSAAVLILSISFTLFQIRIDKYKSELSFIASQQIAYHEYSTPYGVKGKVILPDSSVVWLNSGSSILYPSKFFGETRDVSFNGEGYFDVKKNSDYPMKISLDSGLSLCVRGTSFNLSAYNNDNSISILLLSGNVSLMDKKSRQFVKIEPNQKIFIDKKTNKVSVLTPEDIQPTVGWKKGWLIFDETDMPEIIKKLERWYGVNIVVSDSAIISKTLSAKFREQSLSQVLDLMHRISLINYSIKDSTVLLNNYR